MENQSNIEALLTKTGDYLETRFELLRLKTIDNTSEVASSAASKLALLFLFTFFMLLLSMGAAFWIGDLLGKTFYGFFIVSGFYLFAGLIIYAFRRQWLKEPVSNLIIRKMLKTK